MGNKHSRSRTSAPWSSGVHEKQEEEEEEKGVRDVDDDAAPGPLDGAYRTIGAFDVLDTLGTGTVGRVRLVRHRASKTFFALKVMRKADVVRLGQVEHVVSERRLLAATNHPFIVRMSTHFQDERALYMLMQYAPGGELFRRIRDGGRFADNDARFYAASTLLAGGGDGRRYQCQHGEKEGNGGEGEERHKG